LFTFAANKFNEALAKCDVICAVVTGMWRYFQLTQRASHSKRNFLLKDDLRNILLLYYVSYFDTPALKLIKNSFPSPTPCNASPCTRLFDIFLSSQQEILFFLSFVAPFLVQAAARKKEEQNHVFISLLMNVITL